MAAFDIKATLGLSASMLSNSHLFYKRLSEIENPKICGAVSWDARSRMQTFIDCARKRA